MAPTLWKRAALVPLLVFSLYLLTDNETSESHRFHHLAVFTALHRHPPCLRVYRSLLEFNLVLWGAAASIYLWTRTLGKKMTGYLLFQPPEGLMLQDEQELAAEDYLPIDVDDFQRGSGHDERHTGGTRIDTEDATYLDAQYDSDGEVPAPKSVTDFEPPTAEAIASVAVDSLLLILLSLFFFTFSSAEGGTYVDGVENVGILKMIALVAAPMFPLLLFLGFLVALLLPWKQRSSFWQVISLTVGAPCFHVTFRDGFIGDILTSTVRPMQDIAFTTFYLLSGLKGWWNQSYDLDSADLPLESNWLLHTFILPTCMISPLWWRFLQNLRQVYENKQRWPYLGNALKYFIAAEVAMFGVFDPSRKRSTIWLSCFVLATLYQIWWDVFMDWELFEVDGTKLRLRRTRIYSVKWIYWTILVVNIVLRFCWTLSFLPPHYLNRAGVLNDQFEGDLSHILNPTIASAEIIRRTLWGFLRAELEAIKVAREEPRLKGAWSDHVPEKDIELKVMAMEGMEPSFPEVDVPVSAGWLSSEMDMLSELQIMGELCIYAAAFTSIGLLAAAHRVTL